MTVTPDEAARRLLKAHRKLCGSCGNSVPCPTAHIAGTVIAQAEQLDADDKVIRNLTAQVDALTDRRHENRVERETLLSIIDRLRKGDTIEYSQGRYYWAPKGYMPYEPMTPEEQAALFADRNQDDADNG